MIDNDIEQKNQKNSIKIKKKKKGGKDILKNNNRIETEINLKKEKNIRYIKGIKVLSKPRSNSKEILITSLNTNFKKNQLEVILEHCSDKNIKM